MPGVYPRMVTLFILGVVAVVSIGLPALRYYYYDRARSTSWPVVFGKVEHCATFAGRRDMGIVTYSYRVKDDYYAGQVKATAHWTFPHTDEDVSSLYPMGGVVCVRYDPKRPSVSIVVPPYRFARQFYTRQDRKD